jgi:uncharacterized protein (TIGR03437 family)
VKSFTRRDVLRLGSVGLFHAATARAAVTALLRQPYLQNIQRDRASILWTTLQPGDGGIVLGLPGGGVMTVPATVQTFTPSVTGLSDTFYQFRADITGLKAGTSYSYRATVNGSPVSQTAGVFSTAAPGDVSFLVFGDSGEDTPEQLQVISHMAAEPGISFLVHTGDLAYPTGTFALYDANYFGLNAALFSRLPVFATPGNHDFMADSAAAFLASHVAPACGVDSTDAGRYYSYDWGDIHFAYIDSNLVGVGAGDRMLAWLDRDLTVTGQYWKIVVLHHPPYPTGHHGSDPVCAAVRAQVVPVAERHGVHLLLGGHEHGYERTVPLASDQAAASGSGTVYVISGGGGADLHDVSAGGPTAVAQAVHHYLRIDANGAALTVRAIGLDGNELDRFTLRPSPAINAGGVLSIGDYTPSLAPGSLVSIFGENLALQPRSASGTPLPFDLGGVRVQLEGQAIPLLYVSPGQINAMIPYDAPSSRTLKVISANGSDETRITIQPTAPSILAVTTRDALAGPRNSPRAGSTVVVYAVGLGVCKQAVAAGNPVPGPDSVAAQVDVWLGATRIQPAYAGLTPGIAGLYQVNFTIPVGFTAGTYQLRLSAAGVSSTPVSLVVE